MNGLSRAQFTVFFQAPFWIGLYERWEEGNYQVAKVTFGAEPRDWQVYQFLLSQWGRLPFGPVQSDYLEEEVRINPKRMQRAIARQVAPQGVGTKAQQALQKQREQDQQTRQHAARERRRARAADLFALKQAQKKEKHRGH